MNLDVMGISEMRWPEEKDFWTDEYRKDKQELASL